MGAWTKGVGARLRGKEQMISILPDDGVRLLVEDEDHVEVGTANPHNVPLDAAGAESDLAQEVEAP